MPLHGPKLFKTVSPSLKNGEEGDPCFKIEFTSEVFRDKELYEETFKLYNEKVWTDRCTGEVHLTFKEALDTEEEVYELLRDEYEEPFHKPALEIIHHSTANQEELNKKVYEKFHKEFQIDEVVTWKMAPSKYGNDVRGRIVSVDRSSLPEETTKEEGPVASDSQIKSPDGSQNCASPSSDKENTSGNNNKSKEEVLVNGDHDTTANDDVNPLPATPTLSPGFYGRPSRRASQSPMIKDRAPRARIVFSLLPLLYDFRLLDAEGTEKTGDDNLVKSIPAQQLARVKPPPTKENIKYFIRAHALRHPGNKAPWVVGEDEVKKYGLISKFHSFLLPKGGLHTSFEDLRNKENEEKERKEKKEKEKEEKEKQKEEERLKKEKQKEEEKLKKKEEERLKKQKQKEEEKLKLKLANGDGGGVEKTTTFWTLEEKNTLREGVAEFGQQWTQIIEKYQQLFQTNGRTAQNLKDKWRQMETSRLTKERRQNEKKRKGEDVDLDKSNGGPSSSKKAKTNSFSQLTSSVEKKKMKQMSISELMKKRNPLKSPLKVKITGSPVKLDGLSPLIGIRRLSPLKQVRPMLVVKLEKAYTKYVATATPASSQNAAKAPLSPTMSPSKMLLHEKKQKTCLHNYQKFLKMGTTSLSEREMGMLPEEVQNDIRTRKAKLAERARIAAMTDEERQNHAKEKAREAALKRSEHEKLKRKLEGKREDMDVPDAAPLPIPKPVWTPENMAMETFASVVMVAEFLSAFQALLMSDSFQVISTNALLKALGDGDQGFEYISNVLVILLQTLLQDQISEDYKELKTSLRDIAINKFSATELIRLALRKKDVDVKEDSDAEDDEEEEEEANAADDDELSERLIDKLEESELCSLSVEDKVEVLVALVDRILNSYSVVDHMEKKQDEAKAAWRHRLKAQSEAKKSRLGSGEKEEKQGRSPIVDRVLPKSEATSRSDTPCASGKEGDGDVAEKMEVDGETGEKKSEEIPEGGDMASVVKRRRVVAARDAKEREQKKKEEEEQRRKEVEEWKAQVAKEKMEKDFNDAISGAKTALRLQPVGTDRNHSRYWVFGDASPGLFVEKGWCHKDYSSTLRKSEMEVKEESEDEGVGEEEEESSEEKETTFPETGLNMWFVYDNVEKVENLIKALLPKGLRESKLKAELTKRLPSITKSIEREIRREKKLKEEKEEEKDEEGKEEDEPKKVDAKELSMEGLRKEVVETEIRLRNGGLGGVKDFGKFELKLVKCTKLSDFAPLIVNMQENVLEKFLEGIFAPKKTKVKNDNGEVTGEEMVASGMIPVWREAVKACTTFSRMHVLLGILDTCIKWEKSAENAKCKVCRKKGDETKVLLCDDCNEAFHMYCLRPPLWVIPRGDWLCPACAPAQQRSCRREQKNYKETNEADSEESCDEEDGYSGSGSEEEEIEHDKECVYCGGDDQLIYCSKCPYSYHTDCHQPPLRREPRSTWICEDCRSGDRRSRRTLKNLFKKINKSGRRRKSR